MRSNPSNAVLVVDSDLYAQRSTLDDCEPLRGWVNTFYRNYKGRKLGPYYVRRWKEDGKLHKEYIKPQDVDRVRAACQLNREMEESMKRAHEKVKLFMRNGDFFLRILDRRRRRKRVPLVHAEFFHRLDCEGMYIHGRPPLRRKVTHETVEVDGQKMIRKTVVDLDGTTRDFLVPFSDKRGKSLSRRTCADPLDLLLRIMTALYEGASSTD